MTSGDHDRLLPEQRARVRIDGTLAAAGWVVQDYKAVNLYAGVGVAVRELVTNVGPGRLRVVREPPSRGGKANG